MADELTPILNLIKPDVGASDDTWGEKLNHNFDLLDTAVSTGAVPLPSDSDPLGDGPVSSGISDLYSRGDHVHPHDPAKADVTAVPSPATDVPLMDGTAAIGIVNKYALEDHVHPSDSTKANVTALPVPATVMPLVESGTGAIGTSAKYAREDHVHPLGPGGGGGTSVTIATTAPATTMAVGSLWWESDTGALYILYDDGDSKQWVSVR
jgi:hypothetical protein